MFQNLLKLYKNNRHKIPLEDFNTEIFAGILCLFPKVLKGFTHNFLKLPDDDYQIKTQLRKNLEGEHNCIIDFVLEGESHICFIENKIGSKEGFNQLERYGKVLESYPKDTKKYLCYCTKYSEPKNDDIFGDNVDFKQFKWYEVAKFLKQYNENQLINNYIKFLKINKMEQDNTFNINNLLALENLNKSLEIAEFHIENVKEEFNEKFHFASYNKNFNWEQIKGGKRICHYGENILKSESSGYSEVLYSIEFETLELKARLYVGINHEKIKEFNAINLTGTKLKMVKWDCGTSIFKTIPLGVFLNDENSDKSIKDWFIKSFDELIELIKSNDKLDWNIK